METGECECRAHSCPWSRVGEPGRKSTRQPTNGVRRRKKGQPEKTSVRGRRRKTGQPKKTSVRGRRRKKGQPKKTSVRARRGGYARTVIPMTNSR